MRLATTRKTCFAGVLALLLTVMVFPAAAGAAARKSGDRPNQTRDAIFIDELKDFNPANGVRAGSGTASDPFVISDWNVSWVEIKDTDAHVVVKDNVITDSLTLDWIGGGIEVRNNEIGDLRVNQNRKRTGDPTSGVIENNKFGVVGQLRHFDGIFQNNVVGTKDGMGLDLPFITDTRAVNFDGFNGSIFRNNTIYGYMDARLHGHHHSSGFAEDSHYHGDKPAAHEDHDGMDHTVRYHQVHIYGNKIFADHYYALAYLDTAHSANDRTAASETEPTLNDPHIHHTKVFMHDNDLVGAGLYVDVFNARDERHRATARGLMEISDNKIVLHRTEDATQKFMPRNGIDVNQAQDITLRILDNKITGPGAPDTVTAALGSESIAGINLWTIDKGNIFLSGNSVSNADYGIKASDFTETVKWTIEELVASDVGQAVYWDSSVANAPERRG
ncbi:MAG TPA: hypothetical protein VEU29_05725 [Actinomycetota bacterium]|nr:hypothetical protein [Actinomycetota bacterium]